MSVILVLVFFILNTLISVGLFGDAREGDVVVSVQRELVDVEVGGLVKTHV